MNKPHHLARMPDHMRRRPQGDHTLEVIVQLDQAERRHLRQDEVEFVGIRDVDDFGSMAALDQLLPQPVHDEAVSALYEGDPRGNNPDLHAPTCLFSARAGTPPTHAPSGTSATTAAPAPTIAAEPMRMPGRTAVPTPSCARSPTWTLPASPHAGPTWAALPIRLSWSTTAPVLTIANRPMIVSVPTTAAAMITVPSPRLAVGEMSAAGCMTQGRTNSSLRRRWPIRSRRVLSPSATTAALIPSSRRRVSISSPPSTCNPSSLGAAGAGSISPTISLTAAARIASITTLAWPPAPITTRRRADSRDLM